MIPTLSIIGSAGRKGDGNLMSKLRFEGMCTTIENMIITAKYKWDDITLQSGGAAWCDHVAVHLALKHKCKARLYLPCQWVCDDKGHGMYQDTGSSDWRTNPGKMSNKYHIEMSQKMGYSTLDQIEQLRLQGGDLDCSKKGFHSRNTMVAQCTMMIAMTVSDTAEPCDGGTKDTWTKCKAFKVHIPLSTFPV
jgi:hypothetical protein